MLEVLTVLVGIFDVVTAIFAAAKFWRVSVSVLVATSVIVVFAFL